MNGPLSPLTPGSSVVVRHEHLVHDDLTGDRGAQPHLAVDRRGGEALHAFFEQEATNGAFLILGPDHHHIGDRRIGDPHLGA
jgi:hypothetical protein